MEAIKKLIKKYTTFIKYIFSAGLSFMIDLTLFTIFSYVLKKLLNGNDNIIIYATVTARIISSFINYNINKNAVFKSKTGSKIDISTLIKYVALVIIQMFVSAFSVKELYKLTKFNETLIKIPVECVLFLVNYFVQKFFIFTQKREIKSS